MAQGDGTLYNQFLEQLMLGLFDLANDTIKVIFVDAHTPNIDTHASYADVSADECTNVSGYTTGGNTLAGQTVTQNNTLDRSEFDGTDLTWSGLQLNENPSHNIMYDDTTSSNCLMAYWENTVVTNGGDYTLQWGAGSNPIITITGG